MFCRLDLDLLNFVFVRVSALRHPYMSSKVTRVRMFRYHAAFDTRWFSFSKFFFHRKFTIRTIHDVFTFSWKYSSRPWRFQWPVSRKAVLFHEFISAVNSKLFQLSSGTHNHPDNVLIQGDNMYLNAFNNDLIPREGFLSLNNLPTVVCCRWLEDESNNSSIETCWSMIGTNISPIEVQKHTIDLPILRGGTSLAIITRQAPDVVQCKINSMKYDSFTSLLPLLIISFLLKSIYHHCLNDLSWNPWRTKQKQKKTKKIQITGIYQSINQ